MSSAQLDIQPHDESSLASGPSSAAAFELTSQDARTPALKQQVAERLAAHRARKGLAGAPSENSGASSARPRGRSAEIAAAVAERYAHSQSYRAFLAAEAERAVHQAEAAAQVASINAQAIAVAQQQLLADLENWDNLPDMPRGPVAVPEAPLSPIDYAAIFDRDHIGASTEATALTSVEAAAARLADLPSPPVTVRLYEEARRPAAPPPSARYAHPATEFDEDERYALDEEIDFRHNPVFEEAGDPETIAANLIEFPRQLVAPRKARPRLAEGPLREETGVNESTSQLRIFEVAPDQLSAAPAADTHSPVWSSILLPAQPSQEFVSEPGSSFSPTLVPQAAPIGLRLMAAAVDACLIVAVQLAFTGVFVLAIDHLNGPGAVLEIPRVVAAIASVGTLAILGLLYQLLFFTFSDHTPGMRYARIGLCTFEDENPTRKQMRRRIASTLIAASPLGLGLLWALLDEDTLGWHDRISRMYQRAY